MTDKIPTPEIIKGLYKKLFCDLNSTNTMKATKRNSLQNNHEQS